METPTAGVKRWQAISDTSSSSSWGRSRTAPNACANAPTATDSTVVVHGLAKGYRTTTPTRLQTTQLLILRQRHRLQ